MSTQKIIRYAVSICEDYREDGEVNLTALEEAVSDHFDLTDNEIEDNDVSFVIFKELERQHLL
jgi:hypothetical protein